MLQATNRSPATIATYMTGVQALREFLMKRGMPTAVDAVAREHIEAAYAGWMDKGYAAASVKARHDGIRQFLHLVRGGGRGRRGQEPDAPREAAQGS